jgi:hypothetical protein
MQGWNLTCTYETPFLLLMAVIMLSAGLEMIVPVTPDMYPATHVTPSCVPFEHSFLGLRMTFPYRKSTECSNVENMSMATATTCTPGYRLGGSH